MTLNPRVALLCGAVLLPIAACSAPAPSTTAEPVVNRHEDARFLDQAPVDMLQGVTFAKLAETRSSDPAVRRFASGVADDDSTIAQKLALLLHGAGMAQPTEMEGEQQILFHRLETMSGPAFDDAFINQQLQDQTMTIQLFQAEADSGKHPDLQGLARDSLPVLLANLRTASALSQGR
jgi:putative membrane protein